MADIEGGNGTAEQDYTHPERYFKGLCPRLKGFDGTGFPKEWKSQGWRQGTYWGEPDTELCWVCGWNSYHQALGYSPLIRIMHSRGNAGLCSIGSKWLVRDQANDESLGNDYMTWEFLQKQPDLNIPLVKEMRVLSGPTDHVQLTLISRAHGTTLASVGQVIP
jgi:hypothetical protein